MKLFFFIQVLKEAKEVSEQKAAGAPEGTTPIVDLFGEFDKFQGLAHLEALEMLSRDSEARVCDDTFIFNVQGVAIGCVCNPNTVFIKSFALRSLS